MKKRSTKLLALMLSLCLSLTAMNPVYASGEQSSEDTAEVSSEATDTEDTGETAEAAVVSEESSPVETTVVPAVEASIPEETSTPEEEELAARNDEAKAIAEEKADLGYPKANLAYALQDVNLDGGLFYYNGELLTGAQGKIIAVVNLANKEITYYTVKKGGQIYLDKARKIGSYTYVFDKFGRMVISDFYGVTGKKTYYYKKNGRRNTNLKNKFAKVAGDIWHFDSSSALDLKLTGSYKIKDDGKTYTFYFIKGIMQKNKIYDKRYYDASGHMRTGEQKINGSYYYFRTTSGSTYGQYVTGWYKIGQNWHYYKSKGKAAVGTAGGNGSFVTIGKKTYLINKKGVVFKGGLYKKSEKERYFFSKTASKPYLIVDSWLTGGANWYYAKANGKLASGWKKIAANKGRSASAGWYYFDPKNNLMMVKNKEATRTDSSGKKIKGYLDGTGLFKTSGWMKTSDGNWKYLNKGNGFVKNGWAKISGIYYWFQNGELCQDLWPKYQKMGRRNVVDGKPAFKMIVNRKNCTVTAFTYSTAKDGTAGQYIIPVRVMRCSVGLAQTPTPLLSSARKEQAWRQDRWQYLMGPSWGQYGTNIVGGIYFHSVSGTRPDPYCVPAAYNALGWPASHGCIRLCVRDAKWIYENCNGCYVEIADLSADPTKFAKPALVPKTSNYDPTDPAISGTKAPYRPNAYKK